MSHFKLSQTDLWQRNLVFLWIGVFLTGVGFSEVLPFLSLYIDTLGDFTTAQLNFLSSITFAISFITMAICAPFWGKLADAKGRKLMLLRASFAMAIVFAGMGLVTQVWQLIVLRALQGVFGGFISNATALMATQTPKEKTGYAMGILVTGSTAGQLLGPFIGGTLASFISYRASFFVTAALLASVFFLVLFFVKDDFTPVKKENQLSRQQVWQSLPNPKLTMGLFVTTAVIQAANLAVVPIIPLFIRELDHGTLPLTFLAGAIAAMPGIGTLIAAPRFGKLGDRVGTRRMILIGFAVAWFATFPSAFVTFAWQLMLLRFLMGIADATLLPAVQTLLSRTTPTEITSRIFSYNQSFQSLGAVAGPMAGAWVASIFGYRGIFIMCAVLIVLNACFFWWNTKQVKG